MLVAFLSAFVLAAGQASGEAVPVPDFLAADPGFADLGALAEPLDPANLERAALLASGLSPDRIGPYASRLARLVVETGSEAEEAAQASATTKAESVLKVLHGNLLRAYREDATTLDGILDSGLYNCVSSAVLYMLAARSIGIEVEGVRTSDHAFCTASVDGRSVDVETTNPYGFDPGGKKEFKDSFGRVTGYAYVAPGDYGDRKPIGDRELIGLILSNRASALERSGRFPEAAKLGADYAALCPGPDSRAFQVDRINNLVADLASRRDFADAAASAAAAVAALPDEPRLAALAATASYNLAVALAQAGDWDAAFDAAVRLATPGAGAAAPIDAAIGDLVASSLSGLARDLAKRGDFAGARAAVDERATRAGPAAATAARAAVGEMELVGAANSLPLTQAVAAADRVFAAGEVGPDRYAEAIVAIYGNEAGRMGASGDWLGAAALAERGIAKLGGAKAPDDGSLARAAESFRRNFVADAHNRFARLYNSGDYAGAKAAAAAALVSMPDEPILTRDLATADAASSN
jgi:tetratricopeptide (TPR) repeat protein